MKDALGHGSNAHNAGIKSAIAAGRQSFKNMATRMDNAEKDFVQTLVSAAGISIEDAQAVLGFYRKIKAVKNDYAVSRISVKHGAMLDRDVILRALAETRK